MAAPTFDAVSNGTSTSGDNTWSHTIGSGSNRILLVCVNTFDGFGDGAVNGVTYNGAPMTKAVGALITVSANLRAEVWYLLEANLPSTGSYNIVVDCNGANSVTSCGGISYSNAEQAAPEATNTATSNASTSTYTGSITTVTNDAVIVDSVCAGTGNSASPTASQTERFDAISNSQMGGSGNTFVQATAGSKSMTGDFSASTAGYAHAMVSVAPSGAGPTIEYENAVMHGCNF